MDIFNIFALFGGLALFLFGMDIMGKALEKQAGGKLQKILGKLTDNPLKGFALGLAVTAVIQSSSATTVMVVGFVNSGIMKLSQAVSIIMGSNVGTTVTSWILSLSGLQGDSFLVKILKPTSFAPVLAFIGIVLYMFFRSEKKRGTGTILLGFAVLMTGMTAMSNAVAPLADVPWFTSLFTRFENPILGVLAGAILTAVIQSSSASVGILQALSATGAITYGSAIPIIMGQNIGTCVTAIISSIGANKNAKRAAAVHLYFNIIGAAVFLALFYGINAFFPFEQLGDVVTPAGIAVVHTLFNIAATIVMLPFSRFLEKLAMLTIKDSAQPEQFQMLDARLLATPAVAVDRVSSTTSDMAKIAMESMKNAIKLTHKWDEKLAETVYMQEGETDKYEDAIGTYLVKLSSCSMNLKDSHEVNTLLHTISDFERIGDHSVNIVETAKEINDKNIVFSQQAQDELTVLERAVDDLMALTVECFEKHNIKLAQKVEPLEQVVDEIVRKIKMRHIERLKAGSCTIEYGFVLDDLLTSYERIADHCSNIAVALIEISADSFDTHEYLTNVKSGADESFDTRFDKYRERYRFKDEQ